MITHWKMTWVMAVMAIIVAAMPIQAKQEDRDYRDDRDGGRVNVRVVIGNKDNDDDVRALGNWYGYQSNRYKDIDQETGMRVGNLLQLVTDVDRNSMTVVDRNNRRHEVMLPERAKVNFVQNQGWGWGRDRDRADDRNRDYRTRVQVDPRQVLRPGDLVIVHGYLLADGGISASTVRVYGRSYGWDDDDYDRPSYHGHRAYGEVRMVDARRNVLVIAASLGRRDVSIRISGELIINGGRQPLHNVRRGDRVIFYYENEGKGDIDAYRVVVLKENERYPKDNEPYYCDPDYREHGNGHGGYNRNTLEGRIEEVNSGLLFNTLEFRTANGQRYNLRAFKGLEAIERNGDTIPVTKLRWNDRLRVYYSETNGTLFVQRIEVL